MTSGVAGRYASALFDLAREQNELDKVDQDLSKVQAMLDQSADLKRLVNSPAFAAEDQQRALKEKLKSSFGKDVRLNTKVDPSLLGGLVVKVGSRMFDSSLRTKLMNLKVVLKGTG